MCLTRSEIQLIGSTYLTECWQIFIFRGAKTFDHSGTLIIYICDISELTLNKLFVFFIFVCMSKTNSNMFIIRSGTRWQNSKWETMLLLVVSLMHVLIVLTVIKAMNNIVLKAWLELTMVTKNMGESEVNFVWSFVCNDFFFIYQIVSR